MIDIPKQNHDELLLHEQPALALWNTKPQLAETLSAVSESKRQNITIEIEGQTIEAVKYYFEYPEHIQKETGILGYERTSIPQNSLEILQSTDVNKRIIENKVLETLSAGEYPYECSTHQYALWSDDQATERYMDYLKKKIFTTKIYDLDIIQEESKHAQYPFSNSKLTEGNRSDTHAGMLVYDHNNTPVSGTMPLWEVLKYKDQIEKGELYACASPGLNTAPSNFFIRNKNKEVELSFGFSYRLDNFMREYYEKSLIIGMKQIAESSLEMPGYLIEIGVSLVLDNYFNGNNDISSSTLDMSDISFLTDILQKNDIKRPISSSDLRIIIRKANWRAGDAIERMWRYRTFHSYLPIFIGNNEVPQLSRGHAKYAHCSHAKGIDFFKFKHADHLPVQTPNHS